MELPKWSYDFLKIILTALIVYAVSRAAKRSTVFASIIASLPLTSLLAILWLHREGSTNMEIAQLSMGIFWMVIPGLTFFLLMSQLLKRSFSFWLALTVSIAATVLAYGGFFRFLVWAGVKV